MCEVEEVNLNDQPRIFKQEDLDTLNAMKFEDYSASGGELEYVLVSDTEENREILRTLIPDLGQYLRDGGKGDEDDDMIEIGMLAFRYLGAHVFHYGKFVRYSEAEMMEIIINQEQEIRKLRSYV